MSALVKAYRATLADFAKLDLSIDLARQAIVDGEATMARHHLSIARGQLTATVAQSLIDQLAHAEEEQS